MSETESKNKGGRPPKDPEKKRDQVLKSYTTKEEKEAIEFKADFAGLSVSDFLRDLALDMEVSHKANSEELQAVRYLLGKISGHTNQIAKAVNQGKVDRLDEHTVEMEVERGGKTVTEEMNFRELMIYLYNKLEDLL